MQVPLEIAYHNTEGNGWLDEYIRERAEHLDRTAGGLVACRIVVERSQHQHQTGNPYRVRVEATIPPKKVLIGDKEEVVEDRHLQLRPIIRHAFDAVEKQVTKQKQMMRGSGKQNRNPAEIAALPEEEEESNAAVVRIFRSEGYGFLKVPADDDEYYFHRNAVTNDAFDHLQVGTEVRFEPSMGEEGPQADLVEIIENSVKENIEEVQE